ncbi:hypothetical protein OK074_4683 [Actinobacteria bacterium OK074]|nr:hypothetical protein OK074_4683 [Actinobacteria bacterium OK074]
MSWKPSDHKLTPPTAVPGCAECAALDIQRAAARAEFDWSAETDANVFLRRHQRAEHPELAEHPESGEGA